MNIDLLPGKTKNFTGENFWARGYFVTTIGLDEETVKTYVRHQDKKMLIMANSS
jgi:putative transposase